MNSRKLNLNNYGKLQGAHFVSEILDVNIVSWLIVSLVGLLIFGLNYFGVMQPFTQVLEYITLPSRTNAYQTALRVESLIRSYQSLPATISENMELKRELLLMESRLAEVQAVFEENEDLQLQTGITYSRDYEEIGALVFGSNQNLPGQISVNKGSEDGVGVGDIVVIEKFVIGKVNRVSRFSAEVETLLSPSSNIPVKTATQSLGILTSRNANELVVTQILQSLQLETGEEIYTSGLNNEFPPNLYVGKVGSVESDARASTKQALVATEINFQRLERVVILSNPEQI